MIGPDWTTEPSYRPQLGAHPIPSVDPSRCYSHPSFPQSLFEEMCLSLYTHMTMRGTQNCSWLKVGAIGETCGKRCMGEF